MSTESLTLFISKRLEYVKLMTEINGVGTPEHASLQAACVEAILHVVRCTKSITTEIVLEMKPMLEANLDNSICTTIMSAMDTRVNLASTTPTGVPHQPDKQKHLFVDCYLTEPSWDIFEISQAQIPRNKKLYHMAGVLRKIGLYNGSEKTYSLCADRGQPCFPKGTLVTSTIQWFRAMLFIFRICCLIFIFRARVLRPPGPSSWPCIEGIRMPQL